MQLTTKAIARIFTPVCLLLSPLAFYGLAMIGPSFYRNLHNTWFSSKMFPALLALTIIVIGLLFTLEYWVTAIRGRGLLLPDWMLWLGTFLYNTGIVIAMIVVSINEPDAAFRMLRNILPTSIFLWDLTAIWLALRALKNAWIERKALPHISNTRLPEELS